MKINSKSYAVTYILLLSSLILLGSLRSLEPTFDSYIYNAIINLFFSAVTISIILVWIISIRRRLNNVYFINQYIYVAAFLLIFIALKTLDESFSYNDMFSRYCFYLEYVPMIMVPLCAFYASLYLGKSNGYKMERRWLLLIIPAVILIIFVFTNKFHGLVYIFGDYINFAGTKKEFRHGPVFFIIVAWMVFFLLTVYFITIYRCHNRVAKKMIFIPFAITCLNSLGMYCIIVYNSGYTPYTYQDWFAIMTIMFLESLIQINMVRTNVGYVGFYKSSNMNSVITDLNFNVIYSTKFHDMITLKQMRRSALISGYTEGKYKYYCYHLEYGYFFLAVDLSYLIALNEKLLDVGVTLDEENDIIRAEAELKEKNLTIEKQNEIYNKINSLVQEDVLLAKNTLDGLNPDSSDYVDKVKKALVTICYIKRKVNLFLITYNEDGLSPAELGYSVNELLNYVKDAGISASYDIKTLKNAKNAISLFTGAYRCILFYLDIAESVFLRFYSKDEADCVDILVDHRIPREYPAQDNLYYEYDGTTSVISVKEAD